MILGNVCCSFYIRNVEPFDYVNHDTVLCYMLIVFLKNLPELSLRTDSDEERGHSADSDPVVVDLIDILKEIEGSECEVDNFVHINLEEEQEEPGVLLTGQEDSEEEQSTTNAIETEEEKEEGAEVEEEGTEEGDEDQTASCLVDV